VHTLTPAADGRDAQSTYTESDKVGGRAKMVTRLDRRIENKFDGVRLRHAGAAHRRPYVLPYVYATPRVIIRKAGYMGMRTEPPLSRPMNESQQSFNTRNE